DENEAIEIAKQCPGLEYGSVVEVRPVADECSIKQRAQEYSTHEVDGATAQRRRIVTPLKTKQSYERKRRNEKFNQTNPGRLSHAHASPGREGREQRHLILQENIWR